MQNYPACKELSKCFFFVFFVFCVCFFVEFRKEDEFHQANLCQGLLEKKDLHVHYESGQVVLPNPDLSFFENTAEAI